jgi:hypothetical protein
VEKKQYDLIIEVLRRLEGVGVLKHLILVGSWCIPFYRDYFKDVKYSLTVRTRDIDLLVPRPSQIRTKVDVFELLKDLEFIIGFRGAEGYIKLEQPDLMIEFLVPEKGRGSDAPFPLPQLGINAQPLRFLDFLAENTIRVNVEEVTLALPHPVNFALQKLLIVPRRQKEEKATKDRIAAIEILKAVINKGEANLIKGVFHSTPGTWQKRIIRTLENAEAQEVLDMLR